MLLAALLPAAAGASGKPPEGEWDSPVGRVRIARSGEGFRGTLVAPGKACGFRPGEEVLRGTLVDDSLAGELRVCLAGPSCPAEGWSSALLLVGPERLAGAVHVAEKGCAGPFGRKGGVTLTRARHAKVPRPPGPLAGRGAGGDRAPADGGGRPSPEARARARKLLRDGAAWLQEGNFERARERFLEAIEADAAVPEAYNGVGVTYRMRNDLPAALGWYKKALAVDPDFGDAYYNMACVYALQGERTLALRYLQIAAMNGYATAEGVDGDSDLASLRGTREYRALRDRM